MNGLDDRFDKECKARIKEHEGYRSDIYLDSVGVPTGGYGHALHIGSHLPQFVWELIFNLDYSRAKQEAESFLMMEEIDHLNEARTYVIIDMLYNLGVSKLSKFKKFLQALRDEDYQKAFDEMLDSRWAKQVKNRALTLSTIMLTGTWKYKIIDP